MRQPFPAVGNWLSTKGQVGSYPQHRVFHIPGRLSHASYSGNQLKHKWYMTWGDTETHRLPQREQQSEGGGLGSLLSPIPALVIVLFLTTAFRRVPTLQGPRALTFLLTSCLNSQMSAFLKLPSPETQKKIF